MGNLFLVCLVPPGSIIEDIDEIRNQIAEQYNVIESLKRPVHITLYNPVKITNIELEERFFKLLEDASFSSNFNLTLKNFKSFPTHTVFIDITNNEGIMNLQYQIKEVLKPLQLHAAKNTFKFTPHLTIAFKDVKPEVYELIMEEYKDKKFKREFLVGGFSVYKHVNKAWKPYKEFIFKDLQPKPLSLFD